MAKRFKLRLCRAITATWQSCRSKHPSDLPTNPVLSFSKLITSINKPTPNDVVLKPATHPQPQTFKWHKDEKWHVVANIYDPRRKIRSPSSDLTLPPPPPKTRRRKKKKTNFPTRLRLSTSSADSGWFSSDASAAAVEETETLVSTDDSSSEFKQLQPIGETQPFTTTNLPPIRKNKKRRASNSKRSSKRSVSMPPPAAEAEAPARLSVFKKMIPCAVEGKVKESFAVVKRSDDPYEDFRSSMMDMIVEKQMFDAKDLEQLLQCFLSLNSRCYHGVIVEAFSEIWEAIFSPPRPDDSERRTSVQKHGRVSRLS